MVEIGDKIKLYDPDTKQIKNGVVTRIISNGIRAHQEGQGIIVALREENDGIWYQGEKK